MSFDLRFAGELALWQGLLLGVVVAFVAFRIYRRETRRGVAGRIRWLLPLLRATAILLVILMLTGPVLHHRQVIGQLSRVMVFLDSSQSMTVSDPQMSPDRKLLAAIRAGWLPEAALDTSPLKLADELAAAQRALAPLRTAARSADSIKRSAAEFARRARAAGFEDLAKLAEKLELGKDDKALASATDKLLNLGADAAVKERDARQRFTASAARLLESGNRAAVSAVARFDENSRWQRATAMLTDTSAGLLTRLAERHQVELLTLDGSQAAPRWSSASGSPVPQSLPMTQGRVTDLADGLKARVAAPASSGEPGEQRVAAVLITDGRHNEGPSPLAVAQVLGTRQVPVFTVGVGSEVPPVDLAVVKVDAPESIYREDHLRGSVVLSDRIAGNKPFTLKITHGDQTLFEQKLTTQNTGLRAIPFDLSVAEIVKKQLDAAEKGVRTQSLPLNLAVTVTPIDGEARTDNNTAALHTTAITSEPRLLIIDGRARWETRYLRNLFERDSRWKVTTMIAGPSADHPTLTRGNKPGEFPTERRALFAYDLIVLGEVSPDLFKPEELTWIRDFVQARGGGLILIDGQRQKLKDFINSPLAPLIPVSWTSDTPLQPKLLEPTPVGLGRPALALAGDANQTNQAWKALAPPHWVAPVAVVPGAGEVLVEAVADKKRVPVIVERHVGAGRVVYFGTDETWRWRYEVADKFYQRLWNQVAAATIEQPFAVADQFVSLDVGTAIRRPGEQAEVRVRLRDSDGKPVVQATAEAVLTINGKIAATVPLEADENEGGAFRAKTPPLPEGTYDVSVRVTGFPESQMKARTQLVIQPVDTPEMIDLACNEDLLRQMADASGGRYLREEQADQLPGALEPLTAGRVVESDTPLAHSYWWFVPIVGLLSVEWLLRKRSGML